MWWPTEVSFELMSHTAAGCHHPGSDLEGVRIVLAQLPHAGFLEMPR